MNLYDDFKSLIFLGILYYVGKYLYKLIFNNSNLDNYIEQWEKINIHKKNKIIIYHIESRPNHSNAIKQRPSNEIKIIKLKDKYEKEIDDLKHNLEYNSKQLENTRIEKEKCKKELKSRDDNYIINSLKKNIEELKKELNIYKEQLKEKDVKILNFEAKENKKKLKSKKK